MSESLNKTIQTYKERIENLERDIKEGAVLFGIGFAILISISFLSRYINYFWIYAITIDFIVYSFILIGKFPYRFNKYLSIGIESAFTTTSLLLRLTRALLYGVVIQIILFNRLFTFFNITITAIILFFVAYILLDFYIQFRESSELSQFLVKYSPYLKILILALALAFLGIMMRLYTLYSISNWDEGWYADVTLHMFQSQNWFVPLYYDDATRSFELFDKPPLMFILGSLGIGLFGYTTLAVKWSMGVFSGLMSIAGYFIFSHQKRNFRSDYIKPLERETAEVTEYQKNFDKNEEEEKTTDGKFVGVIFGLSMAATWFLIFYGQTAYLDAAIVSITAFTALFAIKAVDHWFYGNTRRAYIYIFLTAFINMLDLLAKAWQGLIVGPSIAIYIFLKYYEHFVPKQRLYEFKQKIWVSMEKTNNLAKLAGMFGSILTVLTFSLYIPKPDALKTICTTQTLVDAHNTCITFVPNLPLDLFGFTIDLWSVVLAIFVYLAVSSITDFALRNINWNQSTNQEDMQDISIPENSSKIVILATMLIITAFINGLLASFIGTTGFQFIYTRFYKVFTQLFQKYGSFESSIANQIFYGEMLNGLVAVIFGGIVAILFIWLLNIFVLAFFEISASFYSKYQLFKENFTTQIIIEWSFLVPLLFYGMTIGYWAYFLLFKGDLFNHDTVSLMVSGTLLSLFALLLSGLFINFVPKYLIPLVNNNNVVNVDSDKWVEGMKKFLVFMTVTSILIILSFGPFLAWVQFMDQYIVNNPYIIRIPGELANNKTIQPGDLTYTWLFFDYYVDWRFVGPGNAYTVIESLGGLISPLFLVCLPFFIAGIYAFIKKRDYANLIFYSSWLGIVFLTFVPANFQLNYYYLAVFFPYFAISSYGIFWTLKKTPSSMNFRDAKEKFLIVIPVMALISFSMIVAPFINGLTLFQSNDNFTMFIITTIFVVGGFIVCAIFLINSIPAAFAFAFVIFFLYSNFINYGFSIGSTDTDFLIISAILIGIAIFTIRDRMKVTSAIFLFIIILTPVTSTANWANYKSQDDDQYQQIADFILNHHGNYNESTWLFPDAGAHYALRYYLHGLMLFGDLKPTYDPFLLNSTAIFSNFVKVNPDLKFFVIINRTYGNNILPTSSYYYPYIWLKTHFVLVDKLIDKVDWQRVHFYVNSTVLTQSELHYLGLAST